MKKLLNVCLLASCCFFSGYTSAANQAERHALFSVTLLVLDLGSIHMTIYSNAIFLTQLLVAEELIYHSGIFFPSSMTATSGCSEPYPAPLHGCYFAISSTSPEVSVTLSGNFSDLEGNPQGAVLALNAPAPGTTTGTRTINGILVPSSAVSLQYVDIRNT